MCVGSRPFIPAPNAVRVQLIYTLFSQRIENVFHVRSGGGLAVADLDRIEGVFASWWTATGRMQVSNNASLVLIVLDALGVENDLHKEYSAGWTAAGGLAVASAPPQETLAVKLATALAGRSYRGRIYWPGLSATQITSGLISATYRDSVVAAVNTLKTNLAAGGDALAVVSYCHDKAWRSVAAVTVVSGVSARTTMCQQRRRRVPGA